MRLETLKERIENAKAKIERKQGTIEKKTALIEKKTAKIVKLGCDPNSDKFNYRESNHEAFWLMIEVENLKEDIERNASEIEEIKASLAKYEAQMAENKPLLKKITDELNEIGEEF